MNNWIDRWESKLAEKPGPERTAMLKLTAAALIQELPAELSTEGKLQEFEACLILGNNAIKRAGKILVAMVDEDPGTYEVIKRRNPAITIEHLISLERVGRGRVDERLMLLDTVAARRARQLPIEAQRQILDRGVEVAKVDHEGQQRIHRKPLNTLTRDEAIIAIGPDGIRTPEQQVDIQIQREVRHKVSESRYIIEGDEIVFMHDTRMKISDLESLVERLKGEAVKGIESAMRQSQIN